MIFRYFATIAVGKMVLWCYLIWYCVTLYFYFDPSPRLWLNSAGISVVIGIALMLSVSALGVARADPWQTFRLFAMPFGVSSFSSLIKGQGFVLIIPPRIFELAVAVICCLLFIAIVLLIKRYGCQRGAI